MVMKRVKMLYYRHKNDTCRVQFEVSSPSDVEFIGSNTVGKFKETRVDVLVKANSAYNSNNSVNIILRRERRQRLCV